MKIFLKMVSVASVVLFVGCGGGGGNPGGQGGLAYKGETARASLDKNETQNFLSVLNTSYADMIDVPGSSHNKIAKKTSLLLKRLDKKANGATSGSVDMTEKKIDNVTRQIIAIFKNFNDGDGETLDGKVTYVVTVDAQDSSFVKKMSIKFDMFHIEDDETDIVMDGLIDVKVSNDGKRKTLTQNLVAKNNQDNTMMKFEDLKTVLDEYDREISYEGKIYYSEAGYITVSTPVELTYDESGNPMVGGEILYEGKDATVKVRTAYDNRVRVEIDNGNDGTVDDVQVYQDGDFEQEIPNAAPVISISFPQSIYTDTDMSVVSVTVYDPDLDGFASAYEWKVNDAVQSDVFELTNDKFVKHDRLKLTVVAIDDRTGDVKSATQSKEQEVLNSRPVASITSDLTTETVDAFSKIHFDASESLDKDNDVLSYKWEVYRYIDVSDAFFAVDDTWELIESNQSVELYRVDASENMNSDTLAKPVFFASGAGKYIIKCIVSDDEMAEDESQEINITVNSAIGSIEEANLSNNDEYVATLTATSFDLDQNGLKDILYSSETYSGTFLNIDYQDSKKVYNHTEFEINGTLYYGDFNGNGVLDALIFGDTSKILQLQRNNITAMQDINISSYYNLINIAAVSDINNDRKDDIIVRDNNIDQYMIYTDVGNLNEKIVVGNSANCQGIKSAEDINGDGLKDIICTPFKVRECSTDDSECSAYIGMTYFMQKSSNNFVKKEHKYTLLNNGTPSSVFSTRLYGSVMLDSTHMAISAYDGNMTNLYTFALEEDKLNFLSKIKVNRERIDGFMRPVDLNKDGRKDLVSFSDGGNVLSVFIQKENYDFYTNALFKIDTYSQLTDRIASNAIIDDIDNDGTMEIITINGVSKFSYINFK